MSHGLYGTPASKAILACVGTASLALAFPLRRLQVEVLAGYESAFGRLEVWKILLAKVAFTDPKDWACGLLLLYYFRIFERRYGTRRFVSYLLATGLMSLAFEMSLLFASAKLDVPWIVPFPTGPYGMVFSLFVPYLVDIPRVTFTHVLGVPVTGKTFTYLIGLQMACSSTQSLCAAGCGLLSGLLYRLNFARIQSWLRIPQPVALACHRLLGQWLDSPSSAPSMPPNMGATLELQQQQERERFEERMLAAAMASAPGRPTGNRFHNGGILFGGAAADDAAEHAQLRQRHAPAVIPPPSEEQIAQLIEMGFPRDRAVLALQRTSNNLQNAAMLLLHEQ